MNRKRPTQKSKENKKAMASSKKKAIPAEIKKATTSKVVKAKSKQSSSTKNVQRKVSPPEKKVTKVANAAAGSSGDKSKKVIKPSNSSVKPPPKAKARQKPSSSKKVANKSSTKTDPSKKRATPASFGKTTSTKKNSKLTNGFSGPSTSSSSPNKSKAKATIKPKEKLKKSSKVSTRASAISNTPNRLNANVRNEPVERVMSPITRSSPSVPKSTESKAKLKSPAKKKTPVKKRPSRVPKTRSSKDNKAKASSKGKQLVRGHRIASLNAKAMVKALAENDNDQGNTSAASASLASTSSNSISVRSPAKKEKPPLDKKATPKAGSSKSNQSQKSSPVKPKPKTSMSSKSESSHKTKMKEEKVKPGSSKKISLPKKKKRKVQRRRELLDDHVEIIDTKRCKRMASLNASAIMTATYQAEPSRALVIRSPQPLATSPAGRPSTSNFNTTNIENIIDNVVRQWSSTVEEHIEHTDSDSDNNEHSVKTVKTTVKHKMRHNNSVVETISTYEQQHNIHIPSHQALTNGETSSLAGTSGRSSSSNGGTSRKSSKKSKQNNRNQPATNTISSTSSSAFTLCSSPNSLSGGPAGGSISNIFNFNQTKNNNNTGSHNSNQSSDSQDNQSKSKRKSRSITHKYEVKTIQTIQNGSGPSTSSASNSHPQPPLFLPFPINNQFAPPTSGATIGTPQIPTLFQPLNPINQMFQLIGQSQQAQQASMNNQAQNSFGTFPASNSLMQPSMQNYINFSPLMAPHQQLQLQYPSQAAAPSQQANQFIQPNALVPFLNFQPQMYPNLNYLSRFQAPLVSNAPMLSFVNGQPIYQPAIQPTINFTPAQTQSSNQPQLIHRPVPFHPQGQISNPVSAAPTSFFSSPQLFANLNLSNSTPAPIMLNPNGLPHHPHQTVLMRPQASVAQPTVHVSIAPRPAATVVKPNQTNAGGFRFISQAPPVIARSSISIPSILTPTTYSSSSNASILANRNFVSAQTLSRSNTDTDNKKPNRKPTFNKNINGNINGKSSSLPSGLSSSGSSSNSKLQAKKMKAAAANSTATQNHLQQLSIMTNRIANNNNDKRLIINNSTLSPSMSTRSSTIANLNDDRINVVVVDGVNGNRYGKKMIGSTKGSSNKKNGMFVATSSGTNSKRSPGLTTAALLLDGDAATTSNANNYGNEKKKKNHRPHGNNAYRMLNVRHHSPQGDDEDEEVASMAASRVVSPFNDRLLNSLKKGSKNKVIHGWSWKGASFDKLISVNNDEQQFLRKCYPAIKHNQGEVIEVRDCVLLKSGPKTTDLPFVAKITALWESPESEMMMSLLWYYRPEHTDLSGQFEEVYASRHRDANSVACIDDKCYVLTFFEFCRFHRLRLRRQTAAYQSDRSNYLIPHSPDHTNDKRRFPSFNISNELVFFCNKVYDYRQKRILKKPIPKLVNTEVLESIN